MGFLKLASFVVLFSVVVMVIYRKLTPALEFHIGGYVEPGFENVEKAFRKLLVSHMYGGAFAAYYEGKPVVDLWGGYADVDSRQKWERDTITMAYSTTKGMAALCIGVLATRGYVKYEDPVSKYWPEFAANGKEKITVGTLLRHEAGLAGLDDPLTSEDINNNPEKVSKSLANQKPLWEPGTAHGYHAVTFGLYVDQIVRRVDPNKRNVTQFFEDEIAKPLGVDFSLHLKKSESYRDARQIEEGGMINVLLCAFETWDFGLVKGFFNIITSSDKVAQMAFTPVKVPEGANNIHRKTLEISSFTGHGTARALAKIFGMVAADGAMVNGKPLISEKIISGFMQIPDEIRREKIFGIQFSFSNGMALLMSPEGNLMFGAPGYGGQMAYADPKKKVGLGFLTNHLRMYKADTDPRSQILFKAVYASIKKIEESRKQ